MRRHQFLHFLIFYFVVLFPLALSLAIARDGSSGGIARLAAITKDGIERKTILNPDLPQFFEN